MISESSVKGVIRNRHSARDGPIAQSRLERTPDKREVVGSIPTRPTMRILDFGVSIFERSEIKNHQSKIGNLLGGVAQLGEHLVCNQEVIGSIPFTSTNFWLFKKAKRWKLIEIYPDLHSTRSECKSG